MEVSGFDYFSLALGQSKLEDILKFPYVSGPGVGLQNGKGRGREGDFFTKSFLSVKGEEVFDQKGDVSLSISQRGDEDGHYA